MPRLVAISRAKDGEESRAWLPTRAEARAELVDLVFDAVGLSGGEEVAGSFLIVRLA